MRDLVVITDQSCAKAGRTHLYEVPLLPALSSLHSEGRVTVHRAGGLHSHLGVLVNTLAGLGVRDTPPAGGDQDGHSLQVSPASAGGVKHSASLNVYHNYTEGKVTRKYNSVSSVLY